MDIKNLKINELIVMQKNLDDYIYKNRNVELVKDSTLKKRLLSLIVEICEFANETKCFKYWRANKKTDSKKIIEEYIDCLHFILSISINLKIDLNNTIYYKVDKSLTDLILIFIYKIGKVTFDDEKHYLEAFNIFLNIGNIFNFTPSQIRQCYIEKNNINIERQKNNY